MINLIILILATWRITLMLVIEDGPFNVFKLIRQKFGIIYYEDGDIASVENKFFAKVFSCCWCMSVWVSTVLCIIDYFIVGYNIWLIPLYILAVSGGVILIDKVGSDGRI